MKSEHQKILELIKNYLEKHPDQRFGQALFNLGINQFKDQNLERIDYSLRDIHNDNDNKIIKRIEFQLSWFNLQAKVEDALTGSQALDGMSVNEKLYASGLMDDFDNFKISNKDFANYILKSLKVDDESISKILQ